MLARAQNKAFLAINSSTPGGYRVHGFAARNETTRAVEVFLINKFEVEQKVRLTFAGSGNDDRASMVDPGQVVSMVTLLAAHYWDISARVFII